MTVKDKYLFTATLRADGASNFVGSNEYGYFPSAAFAWQLHEEDFIPEYFTDLKLRLGWGLTGNREFPGGLVFSQVGPLGGLAGNSPVQTIIGNPNLKWETTSQINIGVDYGFFDGRLTGSIDYFNKTTDDLLFRFSDREDATDYTPTATNEAGSLRISDGSRIVGAVKSSGQILVWTDTSLHGIQFVGTPFTFGLRQLGANCGLISQHAAVEINGRAYWMSDNSFYMYDGVVKKMPCSVQDYVFDDLSYTNKADIACGINTAFNEIIWYYPSANATQIDRAVAYNYLENTWYTVNLGRTTWLGAYVYENPIATEYDASVTANVSTILGLTAGASYIYEHESGNNQADGTAIPAFLTTGSVEIADGDELMSVSRLVPDFDNLTNNMTATLTLEQYPQSAANVTTTGTITSTTEKIDVRGRGRAVKIKYETNTVDDTAWRLGSTKLQLRPDGRR